MTASIHKPSDDISKSMDIFGASQGTLYEEQPEVTPMYILGMTIIGRWQLNAEKD